MLKYLPLIIKNTLRNRRRTVLTVGSIAASFCLLGVLLAMYNALYISTEETPAQALRVITRNKVAVIFPMPISYRQKIRQAPGVREVMVWQWFGGVYKEPKNFFARLAVEPERFFSLYPEYRVPEDQKRAFRQERTACMVGRAIANKYGIKLGDRVTLRGDVFPVDLELTTRAIYDAEGSDETLYFNLEYLFESLPLSRRDFAGAFTILADSPDSVARIARAVDDQFRNSPVQTKTESERAFQLGFLSLVGNVKAFLLLVCAAVTFTLLLVSGNTMAMAARERVHEIGILKGLGFTPGAIMGIILGEAGLVSLAGGAMGCALAILACGVVRQAPAFIQQLKTLQLQPTVALFCLGVAIVIGVVSSFVPAYSAARTSVLDALRAND